MAKSEAAADKLLRVPAVSAITSRRKSSGGSVQSSDQIEHDGLLYPRLEALRSSVKRFARVAALIQDAARAIPSLLARCTGRSRSCDVIDCEVLCAWLSEMNRSEISILSDFSFSICHFRVLSLTMR